MPSGNWSFPCSPRNPAKVREELRLLARLVPTWHDRGMAWSHPRGPGGGAQLEFGRQLRQMIEVAGPGLHVSGRGSAESAAGVTYGWPGMAEEEDPAALRFRTQTSALSDDNLRWTARARFGTYKFFGFAATDVQGYARLTPAGERFVASPRPGEVLLRQLLKWQYPDNQHRGRRWPAEDFAVFPFIATARLIRELEGLTRREIGLFCFTMRRTEDAAATAEAIRQFRERQRRSTGRTGKARSAHGALVAAQQRYAAEGRRVVLGSTDDYADALIRSFRYTGLFSVRGARIVVANGREAELDGLIFEPGWGPAWRPGAAGIPLPTDHPVQAGGPVQLALGEAPPVRLAAPRALFPDYDDASAFYRHYGDADQPRLPWEDPAKLAQIARALDARVAELRFKETRLRSGRTVLSGPSLGEHLPPGYAALLDVVDGLRRTRLRLERAIDAAEASTPQRLAEALDFYRAILAREVIDPPTFLEWNTWRVFLALGGALDVVPHLALDDDLQPLNTAPGNQPDLEVDYGTFRLVVEVTLRSGADQRQAEARPVTRHILEAQRRANDSRGAGKCTVFGLFVAPRLHRDTVTDFFVALKYRVIERQQIIAIPLTLQQFISALRPFAGPGSAAADSIGAAALGPNGPIGSRWADVELLGAESTEATPNDRAAGTPPPVAQRLHSLLARCVDAALAAETGEDWVEGIEAALRRWQVSSGAPAPAAEYAATPLPLF